MQDAEMVLITLLQIVWNFKTYQMTGPVYYNQPESMPNSRNILRHFCRLLSRFYIGNKAFNLVSLVTKKVADLTCFIQLSLIAV